MTLTGKAELFKKGDTKWGAAELRDEVREGDGVRTNPAVRTTLRTGGGHSIRMAALTQVFILAPAVASTDPQPVRLRLDYRLSVVQGTPLYEKPQRFYVGLNRAF